MNVADYTQTGAELSLNGGSPMAEIMKAGSTPTNPWMQGATVLTAPFSIASGFGEIIEGANDFGDGERAKGSVSMLGGAGSVASGGLGLAGVFGSATAGAYSPVAGAFASGVKGGTYANEDVKRRGWLHDREGENASISEWAAENGQAADEFVTEHLGGPLGTIAGLGATYASSLAGVGIAAGSLGLSALESARMAPMLEKMAAEKNGPSRDSQLIDQFKRAGQPTDALSAFHHGVNGGPAGAPKGQSASSAAAGMSGMASGMASGMMTSGLQSGAQAKQPKR